MTTKQRLVSAMRSQAKKTTDRQAALDAVQPTATERHYTAAEVAEMWHRPPATVRRMFAGCPGVVDLSGGKGKNRILRNPLSVLEAFHESLRGGAR